MNINKPMKQGLLFFNSVINTNVISPKDEARRGVKKMFLRPFGRNS